jgi:hypothetical protein
MLAVLCTRDHGKIIPDYATNTNLNRTVVYCPVDTANYYILDASGSYNSYNNIPNDLVGLNALAIDPDKKKSSLFQIKSGTAKEAVLINGEINNDGKLEGTLQITSSAYMSEKYLKEYNDLGEKKYIEQMEEKGKTLKIASLAMRNIDNDTLPLIQTFKCSYKSADPDGNYMYINPNAFITLGNNPFIAETRISNIDFRCIYSYSFNARFKTPAGYKVDALPKSIGLEMPDKGIIFKRFAAEQDGIIVIRFVMDYKKSLYKNEEYLDIHDFFKKMYELLNEQIVLKRQ